MKVYIAGPMRGIEFYNFPEFDRAKEDLIAEGMKVVSPADIDRENGHDPFKHPQGHDWNQFPAELTLNSTIERDIAEVLNCDAIYMLNGWEDSNGAKAERAVAIWAGKDVGYEKPEVATGQNEDILEEALRITSGDRQASYGPPDQDFRRTAEMWSALFGHKLNANFEPRDVAMAMICLKLSRETHQEKRDNAVDIAGYARCLHVCNESQEGE